MPTADLIEIVRRLSSDELETLMQQRQAEDKALRALWRAAIAREREEYHQAQDRAEGGESGLGR
jgi:hypothetical protein